MSRPTRSLAFTVLIAAAVLSVSGCAGTRLNKGAESKKPLKPAEQIEMLESESRAKDKEITRLQMELMDVKRRLADTQTARPIVIQDTLTQAPSSNVTSAKKATISVPGVTVLDLQKALKSAGYDPGPLDGRLGKRTKQAVLDFQRARGLKADGVVGQKTWSALKSAS